MGAGSTYKAQRSRDKALLKQFSGELNSLLDGLRQAKVIGIIAVAEELTGNYNSARENYGTALKILEEIEAATEENPLAGETLISVVENELKAVQEGLKSKRLSDTVVSPEYLTRTTHYKAKVSVLKLLNN